MNLGELIQLALGEEEARKVDTAIPQDVFNGMTQAQRENRAGWYYAPEAKIFGRLLTKDECWKEIRHKLREGKLSAYMGSQELPYYVADWTCFRKHCEAGEITLAQEG